MSLSAIPTCISHILVKKNAAVSRDTWNKHNNYTLLRDK